MEYNKESFTKEKLEEIFTELFYNRVHSKGRIVGRRGCITYGSKDINDFSHCGNKDCPSCNMLQEVL